MNADFGKWNYKGNARVAQALAPRDTLSVFI
jgi:hypothetical protein